MNKQRTLESPSILISQSLDEKLEKMSKMKNIPKSRLVEELLLEGVKRKAAIDGAAEPPKMNENIQEETFKLAAQCFYLNMRQFEYLGLDESEMQRIHESSEDYYNALLKRPVTINS